MTDYKALREAAEKATPGKWRQHLVDDTVVISENRSDICTTWPNGGIDDDYDFNSCTEQHESDAAYIALANPTTILSLLDALASAEARAETARNDALEEAARRLDAIAAEHKGYAEKNRSDGLGDDATLNELDMYCTKENATAIRALKVKP